MEYFKLCGMILYLYLNDWRYSNDDKNITTQKDMKKGEMGWNEILEKRKLGFSALKQKIFIDNHARFML